jgi:predicted negative regulator of RcsB-dependent stress response
MAGKRDDAIATLRTAKAGDGLLAGIVRERLARLLLDAGKADEALGILADAGDPAGLGARGDAHFALGQRDQARGDYDKALALTTVGSPMRRVLELKLSEVGGAPAQAKAGS